MAKMVMVIDVTVTGPLAQSNVASAAAAAGGALEKAFISARWRAPLKLAKSIPLICHGSHGYTRVNFFWPV